MDTFLFIDTETTGFKKGGSLIQQGQARVCQVAMILTDNNGRTMSEFCTLIKPDGWTISSGAMAVHGITDQDCIKFGIDQKKMVEIAKDYFSRSNQIVAHNEAFDKAMIEVEHAYYGDQSPILHPNSWFCTMKSNIHIFGGKWPKLDQALQHYCNKSLGNTAHDALADARACRDIFFAMHNGKVS
jgi:DNA polymerase-3 subunit epsilon